VVWSAQPDPGSKSGTPVPIPPGIWIPIHHWAASFLIQLRRFEAGSSQPTLDVIKPLAAALSVSSELKAARP
jgi:hypothetical protein